MMKIETLLKKAKAGKLENCDKCHRKNGHFSKCCGKHFSLQSCEGMFILQEPPNEPEDELICCFHHHDQTAINLRYFLEHHNIDTKKIYITNAILHGTKSKKLSDKEIGFCAGVLKQQIECIKPSIIVAFGRQAAKSLKLALKLKKNLENLPEVFKLQYNGESIEICKTYHLSALNFNANKKGAAIVDHWQRLAQRLPQNIGPPKRAMR